METIELALGGLTFRARAAGPPDGRLVLLLHGFPQTSACWRSQLAALSRAGYRAVAPDQRGYSPGARPDGIDAYRSSELVADVLGMASALGADRFDLVGHDWGGAVAWQLASSAGDRLRTLTVVSTPHLQAFAGALAHDDGDQAQRSSYMAFFQQPEVPEATLLADGGAGLRNLFTASGFGADEAEDVDEYVAVLTEPGAMTAALNWYRAISGDSLGSAGRITTPTLYVWSTEDVALGRRAAEATSGYVDGPYRFEVLEGVSHWIPEQAAAELNELLVEHLGAHGA